MAIYWMALAMTLAGCITPATEVMIVLDTDAPRRVISVRTSVSRGSTRSAHPEVHNWTRTGAPTDLAFPASFAVIPGSGPNDQSVTLDVELGLSPRSTGQPTLTLRRTARFRLTPHTTSVVRLYIPISCSADVTPPLHCADTSSPCTVSRYCEEQSPPLTCGENGQCVPIDVMPGADAGVSDAMDSCHPSCTGRTCGSNGCGGSCGTCSAGQTCGATGSCVASCSPMCAGRVCGTDGCHGSCGTCPSGSNCDEPSGQCVCAPNCAGRVCGPDGCGGSCGPCASPMLCDATGACVASCTPDCTGRVCGPNSCLTGSCGTCGAGTACNESTGQCFACNPGAPCATGVECTTGSTVCTGPAPSCASARVADGTPCSIGACSAGTCVCIAHGCDWYGLCDANGNNLGSATWRDDGCGGQISCGTCCGGGTFCGSGSMLTEWSCGCGNPPAGPGWVDQGGDCWHRFVDPPTGC